MDAALPFIVLGAAALFAALWIFLHQKMRTAGWRKTSGQIVEIKTEWRADSEGDKSLMAASIVEFATIEDNRSMRFQDPVWTAPGFSRIGAHVKVIYDPAQPSSALIGGWRPFFVPVTFAIISVIGFIVAAANW